MNRETERQQENMVHNGTEGKTGSKQGQDMDKTR